MTTPPLWTEPFQVRAYEIDPHGALTMRTLCDYLQEAAGNHAQALDVSVERLQPEGLAWVLTRLHVQVARFPRWGEHLRVETWPSGDDGLFASREFLVLGPDDAVLARATSAWLIMHLARKRPVRLPAYVTTLTPTDRPRPVATTFRKLAPPTQVDHEQPFRVRYSDLDLNDHVNNSRYAEWVAEAVPPDVLRQQRLAELELHFRAETRFGETVLAQTEALSSPTSESAPDAVDAGEAAPLRFRHALVSQLDDRLVATARTRWAPLTEGG